MVDNNNVGLPRSYWGVISAGWWWTSGHSTLINMRGNLIWYYCVLYMGSPCYQPVQKISKFWFHLGQG